MRNRIWTELTQSKHNIVFTSIYSDRQRFILRIFNIGILTFSSAGIMGWKIWKDLPLIACILIAGISLLKLLQPHLIMNEKQLKNLDDIHKFYADYYNKIEKLWYQFDSNRITEEQATNAFFKLKKLETDINPIIADTIRSKPKGIVKRCKKNTDEYFNQVFNT
ncbi:hypothetical protein [Tenacibaculum finnmarkense]|uniref:hypothetical protein n=2 Tax=Tenacibaculum finnmarkense TaxID=2781243 RepID=UPI000C656C60|nr:hypothetical protein [Tenacibaculum finnmarkense]MCD8409283.1 hypothetical protein [Tenacibaculum finnmarkense genomovar ulcerans]MCD8440598.1 hypothetical protein [Tenacibaculum finnmarkense genomovar ulcerans]MCD8443520.1 hypothetical protein [Tenacibaculum finnmarkense genomovar ulcerans]MCG8206093.1 hypothetical protein [Tenacibaculum finnmarkense genomovar finnmarkense]MCG8722138.1 hypothetical protein [Tenacibaculum finnmarkense]